MIFWDYQLIDGTMLSAYGVGYDHDMNERLSMSVQVKYSGPTLQADYRSAFHFADNDRGAFYLGPQLGLCSYLEEDAVLVPIGFRTGVRGGLRGFYADLFAGISYSIGDRSGTNGDLSSSRAAQNISPLSIAFGLHLGLGWDRRSR